MKNAREDRVLLFELKKENAEVILRKRPPGLAAGLGYTTLSVKNWDGSYEIGSFVFDGVHICRVIQALRLMILAARECNWRKYQPTVAEILERDV